MPQTEARQRFELILEIADRALGMARANRLQIEKLELVMDLDYADQFIPLNLRDLASAPDSDFAHDVFGIRRHLNRQTKKLEGYFMPRYTA